MPPFGKPKPDVRKMRKKRQRLKKKLKCRFCPNGDIPRPVYVDYKDVKLLKQLVDREGRIMPRRRTGTSAIYQRAVREAVLRARFIGLMPYVADE
ncbi:30S ribosomal protein S18 [Caulifigura coniformis]|uniref:Small ribosomal subunit protein bS18 n=1 Tax=Caulifigura coniformis TaxID=2527983 RepID=A0A517SAE8_9PLAN|nr:30S ribosomal protein S18 [Caulifigura coniformis]QDT53104.1 30S ribosomal protein S18 [Caulifigura coniformis]